MLHIVMPGKTHANLTDMYMTGPCQMWLDCAGAIVGLAALGPTVVRLLLVPLIWAYMHSSRNSASSSSNTASTGLSGRQIQADATRVQQALCHAACSSLFAAVRSAFSLLSPRHAGCPC